jgi:hypothetical protein
MCFPSSTRRARSKVACTIESRDIMHSGPFDSKMKLLGDTSTEWFGCGQESNSLIGQAIVQHERLVSRLSAASSILLATL